MKSRFFRIGFKSSLITTLAILMLIGMSGSMTAQGLSHRIMKGSIVEVEGDTLYLCIGSRDGAQVGQELDVFRIRVLRKEGKASHRVFREKVGVVRITAIVDEHFANATILSGEARKHDIVELEISTK